MSTDKQVFYVVVADSDRHHISPTLFSSELEAKGAMLNLLKELIEMDAIAAEGVPESHGGVYHESETDIAYVDDKGNKTFLCVEEAVLGKESNWAW